jgi:hypothetical protein
MLGEFKAERELTREVGICLVNNHYALKFVENSDNLLTAQIVARRVVRGTKEYNLGAVITSCKQIVCPELEVGIKAHLAILYIVDVGTYFIHAVCRVDGNDIVNSWTAEYAEYQVDGLVGTVAQKDTFGQHSLKRRYNLLQFLLQRVRITVVRLVVWVLISIEKHLGRHTLIFITRRTVRLQGQDITAQ